MLGGKNGRGAGGPAAGSVGRLLRSRARRAPGYRAWQAFRERQQARAFAGLLDRELGGGTRIGEGYSADLVRERLADRAPGRRSWTARPRVVAFGTREWEEHGFWQSFAAVSDFSLWEYREPFTEPAHRDDASRAALAREFLRHVEALDAQSPVHCVFFYASAAYVDLGLLDELHRKGIWTVVMSLDDKHQFLHPVDPVSAESLQVRMARRCDLYWTTWRTGTEIVLAGGGTPWYAPEGADPSFHRSLGLERDLEVVFVGQSYGVRADLVRYLRRRGFAVAAFGAGWESGFVPFERTVELFNRAQVVLGVGGVGHMTGVTHLKGRDFEVPMCGTVYLTSYNAELADHFVIGREILCYSSPEECADLLHWILRRPAEAQAIREAALARSRADHTWERRLQSLLGLLPEGHGPKG